MDTVTLYAHFDGEQMRLDEPYELEPNTKLLIAVLPDQESDDGEEGWLYLSKIAWQGRMQKMSLNTHWNLSLMRLGFLAVLPRKSIAGSIGAIFVRTPQTSAEKTHCLSGADISCLDRCRTGAAEIGFLGNERSAYEPVLRFFYNSVPI